jgi:hypothetical protein
MNLRLLVAAMLVLSGVSLLAPGASACTSSNYLIQTVCEEKVPCLSLNCILGYADDGVTCAILIATYNWADYDPAHDAFPSFACFQR